MAKTVYLANLDLSKNNDKNFSEIILNNSIPFRKKEISNNSITYKDCLFNLDNIKLFKKYIKLYCNIERSELTEYSGDFNIYIIASDGGSFNNGYKNPDLPMFASSATIITKNGKIINIIQKRYKDKTNNFAELQAGVDGLDYLIKEEKISESDLIILSSDSQYFIKGFNEWIYGWIKRGWKNNENENISNSYLWKYVWTNYINNLKFSIMTCWNRGHTALDNNSEIYNKLNFSCDYLCNFQINFLLQEANLTKQIRKLKGQKKYEEICLTMKK